MARRGALVLLALAVGLSLAGGAQAYTGGPITQELENLFWVITFFALLVGAVVYGLLFWFLYRYRRSASPNPATEMHGNRRLEIVWTVIPTIILIIITLISVPVLYYTDTPPRPDTTVTVIGQRFTWTFRYEDNSTSSDLWIQEKVTVALDITAMDVIHSFAVADLGVKIDAVPGRMNHFWIRADVPGDYLVQCAEFCGVGHYGMRSTVHVFRAGSQPRIFGPPLRAPLITNVELSEPTISNWTITPRNMTVSLGARVSLRIWNNASSPHDFHVDAPVNASVPTIDPFESAWLNFTANASSPSPIPYGPSDPAARAKGMVGNLTIQSGRVIAILLGEDPPGSSTWFIRPEVGNNPLRIAKGETVFFELKNVGVFDHNFGMGPPYDFIFHTASIGQYDPPVFLGPFTFDKDASSQYWCIIHEAGGMIAPYEIGAGGGGPPGVPLFDMTVITIGVSVPVMFVYLVHHGRRHDEPA